MSQGHGGNVRKYAAAAGLPPEAIIDFSVSINPFGPPSWLRPVLSRATGDLLRYPDPDSTELIDGAVARFGVERAAVVAGNGSSELLYWLPRVLPTPPTSAGARPRRAWVPVPSYIDYVDAARKAGWAVERLPMAEAEGFAPNLDALTARLEPGDLFFLGQPNNPTGRIAAPEAIRAAAARHPESYFVIDEAYADFVPGLAHLAVDRPANVIVLYSLTKFYSIPGLRLGLAFADPAIAEAMRAAIPSWSVGGLAQAVGVRALRDTAFDGETQPRVIEEREALRTGLGALPGVTVFPSESNFLLAKIEHAEHDAASVAAAILPRGLAIRTYERDEALDGRFFRVAVRQGRDNERLVEAMRAVLDPPTAGAAPADASTKDQAGASPSRRTPVGRTPALMLQGVSSNCGKSILCAALCRILLREGYRVAPFKSQNMALNSYVTHDGLEMGRAQVLQAQACRLEPDARMNPILLKPNSDVGSQVIVDGKPVGSMNVLEYVRYKPTAFAAAQAAYDALAAEMDVMIIEGAGSPGEVNLKAHDIANMAVAEYADAPVLIVGDIDRGGVYASLIGTLEVLAEAERRRVRGYLINKFRGDASLLAPAHDYLLEFTGKPVLGVVPYLHDLGLPEEDSVGFRDRFSSAAPRRADCLDIALLALPHISNFTDFDPFLGEPDVVVRSVREAAELGRPDALLLPGSKNVLGDLAWLRAGGWPAAIAAARAAGTRLVGLCGGYQMLGRTLADPLGIEGAAGSRAEGLGFLPLVTELGPEKVLRRIEARHRPSGLAVRGYEIHHGRTERGAADPLFEPTGATEAGEGAPDRDAGIARDALGAGLDGGAVWGSYLHGLFDADPFRRWFLDALRVARGWEPLRAVQYAYDLEDALDRLADAVRDAVDLDAVLRLLDRP